MAKRKKRKNRPPQTFEHDLDANDPVQRIVLEEAIKLAKLTDHDYANIPRKPVKRGPTNRESKPTTSNHESKPTKEP